MPPEDELADEVPLRDENDSADASDEVQPASPSDSGVDFAVGGAPDVEQQYDYDGPTEDLSGELADDAGDGASYGYDTAAETQRFDGDTSGLVDNAATPDDSDQYRLADSDPGESSRAAFVEEVATAGSDEAAYEPPPAELDDSGYASHHPDMGSHHPDMLASDEAVAEEEPASASGFTVEEAEPEPAHEPERPKARPAPPPKPSRPEPAPVDDSPKPGQVRKSAIDEMFARAAELKRQKPGR